MGTLDVSLRDVRAASERIGAAITRTPVMTSATLDGILGARCHFKCENLQKTGAFKARGALNAVLSCPEHAIARGVATHSSGNHGAALSWAARIRGVPAFVVVPSDAPNAKKLAVSRYGGRIIECGASPRAREEAAAQIVAETSATLIHPYDDPRVIAGQGTCALELLQDTPALDYLYCSVGGGGQISGVAIAAAGVSSARVIGVEPKAADDAYRSLLAGALIHQTAPQTIADGLLTSLSERTLAIIKSHVDEIVLVEEAEIIAAMRLLWDVLKIVVEPSGAVAFAGARKDSARNSGKAVGVVISGGNLDLEELPWKRN